MPRLLLTCLLIAVVQASATPAALAHGDDIDVIVEARASDPLDVLHTDYAITLTFADGDEVENAVISAEASDGTRTVLPIQVVSEGSVYLVHFVYPEPGAWTLDLAVDHPDVQVELSLVDVIPIGDPGTHLVRLNTLDESAVGSAGRLIIPDHPLAEPPVSTTTTLDGPQPTTTVGEEAPTAADPTTTVSPARPVDPPQAEPSHGAMVQVTTSGVVSLPLELTMRWAHLGMITLWGLAVLAVIARLDHPLLPAALLAGLAGTLVTGMLLGLWGTPVGYPGIFRWSDLGSLEYGSAWQSSFLLKMAGVLIAVAGTAGAVKRRGWGGLLAVAGMGLALIAVTALSQFHLLTHG